MRLDPYPTRDDGMRVWLSSHEMDQLIAEATGPQQKIAFLLAGRCGLRRSEITQVCPKDFVTGPTGKHVRIWEDYAKREHYREPPVPENLYSIVETYAWEREDDAPVVDDETERSKREIEAEAVAYIVGRCLGLDTRGSTFYLPAWQDDDADAIQDRLGRIGSTAEEIIETVDG
jgi:hypothetical protein